MSKRYCTSCGTPNESTNKFCFNCGSPVSLEAIRQVASKVKEEAKKEEIDIDTPENSLPDLDNFKVEAEISIGKAPKLGEVAFTGTTEKINRPRPAKTPRGKMGIFKVLQEDMKVKRDLDDNDE